MPQTLVKKSPIFRTKLGRLYCGHTEAVVTGKLREELIGKVNLIVTSPPFPLNAKKRYSNLLGDEYLEWLGKFGPLFSDLLADDGSLVIEIGNAWEPKRPIQSLLPLKALMSILEKGKFVLCQEITYFNPARLPSPAQWVTVNRERLKDATTKIWWMAKSDRPKANNKNVLQPYSKHMVRLLRTGKYNAGVRPSEHTIGETSFLKDNGGSIPSNLLQQTPTNLIQLPNTHNGTQYQQFCKDLAVQPHPARMPEGVVDFFIKFLTDKNDLVFEPFAGSNTTGMVAEKLERRWLSVEANPVYATSSVSRFCTDTARGLLADVPKEHD